MAADLSSMIADVTAAITVDESATILVNRIPQIIQKAKEEVLANGVSEAQLRPLSDLIATMRSRSGELSAGVTANTPAE